MMLNVIMLSVIMLSVIMLSVVLLNVIMQSVILPSVVALYRWHSYQAKDIFTHTNANADEGESVSAWERD
jgi:hypothetical protein